MDQQTLIARAAEVLGPDHWIRGLFLSRSRDIRRTALMGKIPYYTTIPGAVVAVEGIVGRRRGNLTVRPLQDYFTA